MEALSAIYRYGEVEPMPKFSFFVLATIVVLAALASRSTAGELDGAAVLGAAIGGATGAAVGSAVGGREGAVIGAGVGSALDVGIATHEHEPRPNVVTTEVVQVREVHHYHHPRHRLDGWSEFPGPL